ncbi:pentatricopeptide repeat-containing protein At2g13600-like [Amborella trichopoda]|uniref:Pentacotripeptide-repeat region of PRORP domain-containing protein n=1 Tax=Amborella trichopoda TaxID=13333 RepID=U5CXP2_AMBTC|nr:pentatricopeptide repeat-containing protein At2g13600-like [Amborella trichopoda]ERN14924.1 hypothetical protein AMTR_s00032p00190360 [Amborella trichopoda]|eukprot:XP_020528580.1 pentatricopeptide repeat-containing protein At2g13600-like [Amborella trichopoda]
MGSLLSQLQFFFQHGRWQEVLIVYRHYQNITNLKPNNSIFSLLIKSCSKLSLRAQGQAIHGEILKLGFDHDAFLTNALISMYGNCRDLDSARKVFDEIPEPGVVSWNSMISSYFHSGHCNTANELFKLMKHPNLITWSVMIVGYSQNGHAHEAMQLFKQIRREAAQEDEFFPDSTIVGALLACAQAKALSFGEQIHAYTVKVSDYIHSDPIFGGVLLDMYSKCNSMEPAQKVFDSMIEKSVVAWSIIVAGYVNNSCHIQGLELFRKMVKSSAQPNPVTLANLIPACGHIKAILHGKEMHSFAIRTSMVLDMFVSTSLIDMYSKFNNMTYAIRLFDNVGPEKTTAIWNALIGGWSINGQSLDDIWCVFRSMIGSGGACPNSVTIATLLPVCAKGAFLLFGRELHCYALKLGLDSETIVGNALVDMYAKCGTVGPAERQFEWMESRSKVSWTAMISCYGMHGDGERAIRTFERMTREKQRPDHITFVSLLSACSHTGLVREGLSYFKAMGEVYGLKPTQECYACVVDMLGRSGHVEEAIEVILGMPIKPSASTWGALLSACRIHGNVGVAEFAVQKIDELKKEGGGFHTLMSNIYAEMGREDGVVMMRREMREKGVAKRAGCSWLERKREMNAFFAGDFSHPQTYEIYEALASLRSHLKDEEREGITGCKALSQTHRKG